MEMFDQLYLQHLDEMELPVGPESKATFAWFWVTVGYNAGREDVQLVEGITSQPLLEIAVTDEAGLEKDYLVSRLECKAAAVCGFFPFDDPAKTEELYPGIKLPAKVERPEDMSEARFESLRALHDSRFNTAVDESNAKAFASFWMLVGYVEGFADAQAYAAEVNRALLIAFQDDDLEAFGHRITAQRDFVLKCAESEQADYENS